MSLHEHNSGHGPSSSPIPPNNPEAGKAMAEAGRRLSIISGTWEGLAKANLTEKLGDTRSQLAGAPNITENPLKQLSEEVSTAYDSEPSVTHAPADGESGDPDQLLELETQMNNCGRWLVAQQMQVELEAVNQAVLYFSWARSTRGGPGRLNCEIARMDRVHFLPMPGDSRRPGRVSWARREMISTEKGKEKVWVWHVWDVRPEETIPLEKGEPSRPYFRVLSQDEKTDLTAQFVKPEEWQGEGYPWRAEAGDPLLPFQLYHRRFPSSGALVDPWTGSEVVSGTLQASVNWTQLDHATMRASFSVRGIIGGRVQGVVKAAVGSAETPVMTIPGDPAGILYIRSDGEGSPTIFEWGSPVDIEKHEGVFRRNSARLAVHFGLSAADVQITKTPSSGIALKITREGKRKIAAKRIPNLRRGDLESFAIVSAILRNNPSGDPILVPESGYRIEYGTIELSVDERRELTEAGLLEIEAGVLTRLDLRRRLHPGETEAEAFVALARSEVESRIEAASQTPEGMTLLVEVVEGRMSARDAKIALVALAVAVPVVPDAPIEETP